MNTSPRLTCKWSKPASVLLLALACVAGTPGQEAAPGVLPPFLEEFRANRAPAILTEDVAFASAVGTVRGYLARPDKHEALPALLLVHDQAGLTRWLKESARELASIGYVVLAVDVAKYVPHGPDERSLADLSASVRWLRRRPEVLPERLGVVGWAWGAEQALALAATTPVQACVSCYGALPADLAGLRMTPLLVVSAGPARPFPASATPRRLRVFTGVAPGFMTPESESFAHAATEEAWVEIYNFLGKYVEDADENGPTFQTPAAPPPQPAIATIADLMRAVNEPVGIRGALIRALAKPPADVRSWEALRAQAALVAEAGVLLEQRQPPRGTRSHWQEQAEAYTATARRLVTAADARDYAGARAALMDWGERCMACHRQHR